MMKRVDPNKIDENIQLKMCAIFRNGHGLTHSYLCEIIASYHTEIGHRPCECCVGYAVPQLQETYPRDELLVAQGAIPTSIKWRSYRPDMRGSISLDDPFRRLFLSREEGDS